MPPRSLGKLRRLQALSDYDGRLQIADLRLPAVPADLDVGPRVELTARVLSGQASAVCLAPPEGLPRAAAALDRGAALILSLSHPSAAGPLRLVGGWSLAKTVRCGAAGALVRLSWPVPGDQDEQGKALDQLRMIGDECAKYELPLIVHLDPAAELLGDPIEALAGGLAQLGGEEFQADLLAAEVPDGADLAVLAAAAPLPWLVAGAPGRFEPLWRMLAAAGQAGACGYLCGGASWLDGPAVEDETVVESWLHDEALRRLRRLNLEAETCRPWFEHPALGGLAAQVPEATAGWHRGY